VGGAAADHDEVSGGRRPVLAVSAALSPRQRLDVEHRSASRDGAAVTQPEPGADPRAEHDVGMAPTEAREVGTVQMAHPDDAGRQAGAAKPVDPVRGLGNRVDTAWAVQRQVQRESLQRQPVQRRRDRRQLVGADAVPPHRGAALDGDASLSRSRPQRVDVRHGPDGASTRRRVVVRRGRCDRREDQHVAREVLVHLGDLSIGADRDRVHAEHGALHRQPRVADAVAVALGDRHQPWQLSQHSLVVVAPPRDVDLDRERHPVTAGRGRGRRP